MAKLYDFKLTGFTSTGTLGTSPAGVLGTVTVEFMDNGEIAFTPAGSSVKRTVSSDPNLNALLKDLFTGTGGFATGKKVFGI